MVSTRSKSQASAHQPPINPSSAVSKTVPIKKTIAKTKKRVPLPRKIKVVESALNLLPPPQPSLVPPAAAAPTTTTTTELVSSAAAATMSLVPVTPIMSPSWFPIGFWGMGEKERKDVKRGQLTNDHFDEIRQKYPQYQTEIKTWASSSSLVHVKANSQTVVKNQAEWQPLCTLSSNRYLSQLYPEEQDTRFTWDSNSFSDQCRTFIQQQYLLNDFRNFNDIVWCALGNDSCSRSTTTIIAILECLRRWAQKERPGELTYLIFLHPTPTPTLTSHDDDSDDDDDAEKLKKIQVVLGSIKTVPDFTDFFFGHSPILCN